MSASSGTTLFLIPMVSRSTRQGFFLFSPSRGGAVFLVMCMILRSCGSIRILQAQQSSLKLKSIRRERGPIFGTYLGARKSADVDAVYSDDVATDASGGRSETGGKDKSPKKFLKSKGLPSKICACCGRPMIWRKSWAKNWDEVKYCGEKCRRSK